MARMGSNNNPHNHIQLRVVTYVCIPTNVWERKTKGSGIVVHEWNWEWEGEDERIISAAVVHEEEEEEESLILRPKGEETTCKLHSTESAKQPSVLTVVV